MKKKLFLPICFSIIILTATGSAVQNVIKLQQLVSKCLSDCPDDFYLLVDTGGFAPWSDLYSLRIHSNGQASYYTMGPENRENGTWTLITSFQFTENEMDQLWGIIVDNNFFTLQDRYYNGDICDGTFANLTITANQETYSVQTDNRDILEFDNIVKKINQLTPDEYDLLYNALYNNAPWKPSTPTGETQGKVNQQYAYSTQSFDFDDDDLYYFFDWGDGTDTGWLGPYENNIEITVSHIWEKRGQYNVKVKAMDDPNGDGDISDGLESQWSDMLPISMPKAKITPSNMWDGLFTISNGRFSFLVRFSDIYEKIETKPTVQPMIINAGGTTATYEEECKITVKIQICLCGSWVDNASQGQIDTLHTQIKNDFMSRWNKDQWDRDGTPGADGESAWRVNCTPPCDPNTPGCTVHFNISVAAQKNMDPKTNVSGWHTINIPDNNKPPGTSTVTGWDTNGDGKSDDFVKPNDGRQTEGNWSPNEPSGVYAHECGHLMGLGDQYVESTINIQHPDGTYTTERSTYPIPGKNGNLMAGTDGYPDQNDIDMIVSGSNVQCPCKCCPKENDTVPPQVTIVYPVNKTEIPFNSQVIVQGFATDTDPGIVELDYLISWDGGTYNGNEKDIDPAQTHVQFTLNLSSPDDYVEPDSTWIRIVIYATDADENTGSSSIILYRKEENDTTPPVTVKNIGQPNEDNGHIIWPFTPITLTATDDMSGVQFIHYEVWWDTNDDSMVDTRMVSEDVYQNSCMFHVDMFGILHGLIEIRYFAVDKVNNAEMIHIQQHIVTP
ncbi:MAG: hypothetical protein V1769_00175 [Thermoplasmatota archaeon]